MHTQARESTRARAHTTIICHYKLTNYIVRLIQHIIYQACISGAIQEHLEQRKTQARARSRPGPINTLLRIIDLRSASAQQTDRDVTRHVYIRMLIIAPLLRY